MEKVDVSRCQMSSEDFTFSVGRNLYSWFVLGELDEKLAMTMLLLDGWMWKF